MRGAFRQCLPAETVLFLMMRGMVLDEIDGKVLR